MCGGGRLLHAVLAAVLFGREAGDALEELAEEGLRGEVHLPAQLLDGHIRGAQQRFAFHYYIVVYPFGDAATAYLADDARQVFGREAQPVGIELHLPLLLVVLFQQLAKTFPHFFVAPRRGRLFVAVAAVEVTVKECLGECLHGFETIGIAGILQQIGQ